MNHDLTSSQAFADAMYHARKCNHSQRKALLTSFYARLKILESTLEKEEVDAKFHEEEVSCESSS